MWNILEKVQNVLLKGFDKRPLLFTEKRYADMMAEELNNEQINSCLKFIVVEYKNE